MTSPSDGRYGFDFWQGRWTGRNRKLVDVFDPDCHDWIEFDGECQALSTLGGLGSIDTFVTEMPGRGHFEGMTVRLFNPETSTWKIWWASTRDPGILGTPVEGNWVDNVGQFYGDEELNGRIIKVQYEWTYNSPTSARWRQFFSFDDGKTWQHNWTTEHSRTS